RTESAGARNEPTTPSPRRLLSAAKRSSPVRRSPTKGRRSNKSRDSRPSRSPTKRPARGSPDRSPTKKAKKTGGPGRGRRFQSVSPSRANERGTSPVGKLRGTVEISPRGARPPSPIEFSVATPSPVVAPSFDLHRRRPILSMAATDRSEIRHISSGPSAEPWVEATVDQTQVMRSQCVGEFASSLTRPLERAAAAGTSGVSCLVTVYFTVDIETHSGAMQVCTERTPSFSARKLLRHVCWLLFTRFMTPADAPLCRLQKNCTVIQVPTLPQRLLSYLRWKLFLAYAVFLLVQATLQALPLGRVVHGFPIKLFRRHVCYEYRLNG
ncbi:unnamed protein product, partial [Ixodes hexagonus]